MQGRAQGPGPLIPEGRNEVIVTAGPGDFVLSDLGRPLAPDLAVTQGDLLRYYVEVGPALLDHLRDRPLSVDVATLPRPEWLAFWSRGGLDRRAWPLAQDLPSLLWIVNRCGMELRPSAARWQDPRRPDWLAFSLEPGGSPWERVVDAAFVLHEALEALEMTSLVKTSGTGGLDVVVPIRHGPTRTKVLAIAQNLASELERRHPRLLVVGATRERDDPRIILEADGTTRRPILAPYAVGVSTRLAVSTPLSWDELWRGVRADPWDFDTGPKRLRQLGDLWHPVIHVPDGRVDLDDYSP